MMDVRKCMIEESSDDAQNRSETNRRLSHTRRDPHATAQLLRDVLAVQNPSPAARIKGENLL